jgi:hypothetical protein
MKSQITLQDPITQDYFEVDRFGDKDSSKAPGISSDHEPQVTEIPLQTDVSSNTQETGSTSKRPSSRTPLPTGTTSNYLDRIPSEYHAALNHLDRHGSLNEQFLVNTLGGGAVGARKARKFASKIEEWDSYLPFKVIIEQSTEGKVYRKRE